MSEREVRIVRLEPQRVAAAYGFGAGPEGVAWANLARFVKEKGLDKDGQSHRYFGFNNPSPSAGSPNYGYEQWITVGPDIEPGADVKIKTFSGGLYAVAHCTLDKIMESWQALASWREKSPYRSANHQWLEECFNPILNGEIEPEKLHFDLYLPISE